MLNESQFELALTRAAPKLWGIAVAMCRNHHAAQDLVQEAGMIAWKKRASFAPGTSFNAWTGQIVRNLALRHGRDSARHATLPLEPALAAAGTTDPGRPAELDLEAAGGAAGELGDRLNVEDGLAHALTELSDVARSCFLLRSVEQQSYDEIATLLDIPASTAMSHVHRSRKRILLALSSPSPDAADTGPERRPV